MSNILEQIDLFGKNINFKYKNYENYKNTFGGILSMFTILISLAIYIYFFYNYVQRKESKIIYQPVKYQKSPTVNLLEYKFYINISIDLNNGNDTADSQSIVDNFYVQALNWDNYSYHRLTLKNCLESSINCWTVQFNENEMLTGEGDSGIVIVFSFKDKEGFKKQYNKDSYIDINTNMSDISFSLDNYWDPFQNLERSHQKRINWDSINRDSTYIIDLNYGLVNVTTDYAYFFETNIETKHNLTLFNIGETREISQDNLYFYIVKVNLIHEGHSYKKSFQKLSEFLASASSVSSIVFLIFGILSETYKNISLEVEILNSIFQYDSTNKKEPIVINLELNSVKEQRDVSINVVEINNNSKRYFNRKMNNLEIQKSFPNNVGTALKYNQRKMVAIALCGCYRKQNSKLYTEYEAGSVILNYYIKFDNYLLKMIELDYLKYLILSKDQLNLFKFIKLDYLSNTENKEYMSIITNLKENSLICNSLKEKNENLKENQSLLNLLQKSDHNEIDKKILNSVGFIDLNQSRIFSYT